MIGRQAKATASITHRSKLRAASDTGRPAPEAMPAAPSTARMLNTLLPTTLPTAMSRWPRMAATIEVAISGIEVPTATTVRPITRSLTPKARANATAESTSQSAPTTSITRPPTIRPTCTAQWRSQVEVGISVSNSSCTAFEARRDCTTRKTVYAITRPNSAIDSSRPMLPSSAITTRSAEAPIMIGISWRMICSSTSSGVISAEMPRISSTLAMLLPTTLPIARSGLPASAEPTDTAISGALVPKATTVRPTTSGDTPKETASREAPRTSTSAPTTSTARPAANIRTCWSIEFPAYSPASARSAAALSVCSQVKPGSSRPKWP